MSDNFYQSPSSKPGPGANQYPFFDTRGLAKVISFLFYGTAVFSLVGAWISNKMIGELQQEGMIDLSGEQLTQTQSIEQGVTFIATFISVALIINYLVWMNKSYKNLYSLNATNLQHSPVWAVGFWFIPFINLVKPFQVILEIYRASQPEYPEEPNAQWKQLPVKPYVYLWWFAYVGVGVIGAAAGVQASGSGNLSEVELLIKVYEISIGIDLVTSMNCFLAARVVSEIAEMQFQRYVKLHSSSDSFIA